MVTAVPFFATWATRPLFLSVSERRLTFAFTVTASVPSLPASSSGRAAASGSGPSPKAIIPPMERRLSRPWMIAFPLNIMQAVPPPSRFSASTHPYS